MSVKTKSSLLEVIRVTVDVLWTRHLTQCVLTRHISGTASRRYPYKLHGDVDGAKQQLANVKKRRFDNMQEERLATFCK